MTCDSGDLTDFYINLEYIVKNCTVFDSHIQPVQE
ncbi:predicted protein [Botrytis cinerea T4]|uniref:Uncharacterized protein n=1 Tax=Botryotinia fuckeliana (strain T4) TaxID=999810 RepID=G2YLA7_BOTF4|nr:predicted protein [Botrytis cinerea T4]